MGDPSGLGNLWGMPLTSPLPTLEPKVDKIHELMTWPSEDSMTTYTHAESPEEWGLSSRVNERRSHQSLLTYEESSETSQIQNL